MNENIIKFENASLKLGNFIVEPINLEIPKGYIVGIQGDNGAGKTTLLRMIAGLYEKMQGSIFIDGLDVLKNKAEVKRKVGFISQDRSFFMDEDAGENERIYSPFYHDWDSNEYAKMLYRMKLSNSRTLGNYSTGEFVKFQFAFAAATKPEVLLLDEPTANLDPVFRDDFLKILQDFVADYEITILLATHLEEDLIRVADYIIDVADGKYCMRECD